MKSIEEQLHPAIRAGLEAARKRVKKYKEMGVIVEGDATSLRRLYLQQTQDFKKFKSRVQTQKTLQRLQQRSAALAG
ncbi:Uncharacterised protein [Actinobacillus lignieresii]|uniref:hypothetical protein n=1 Tax=Actinobacillus lignieresii TaxID=720 RepID=UPI000E120CBB|nr:hypothetical protein [Actinobacillus lignieresii]SUT96166.1 Uncharacterised protein [Actinobacillus lignieresii]